MGGAAIAATGVRGGRLAPDVDSLTGDQEVLDEARLLAQDRGLPPEWLNPNAKMWMPPLPVGVLDPPGQPGLRVTYADDGFLLATKLVAQRAKDAEDIVALATRLRLLDATAEDLERHLRRYYTSQANLEFIIDGTDIDAEITMLCRDASRMLGKVRDDIHGET
ncbi:hypothetical protein [Nocardioides plantarum]|uniref:Uncharacterized protein n=1 Tax=Nocardioides plantarum TaxID=29299 RepID=A0ABV5KC16_9ACTN|nr:hypothetical protein [Nocardioides plantarum]